MGYYSQRSRRRPRRPRKPRSPPWVLLLILLATVFLAVHWRARLLPIVMSVPRTKRGTQRPHPPVIVMRPRRIPARPVARKPTARPHVRAAHRPPRAFNATAPPVAAPRLQLQHAVNVPSARSRSPPSSDPSASKHAHRTSPPSRQHGRSHLSASVPTNPRPGTAQPRLPPSPLRDSRHPAVHNRSPRASPGRNASPSSPLSVRAATRRVCRAYLCSLWDGVPALRPLPPLPAAALPWVHGSAFTRLPPSSPERSIFTARRKGPWMGCARRDAQICTGVYRSLKRVGASSLFDVDCGRHTHWLPKVLDKLLGEYRLVRLLCAVRSETEVLSARRAFGGHVQVVQLSVGAKEFPAADVVLVRESLLRGNLIDGMAMLRKVKRSGARFVVHDNFPRRISNWPTRKGLRINAALPPFSMPPPVYVHGGGDGEREVVCRSVADMFATRSTPTMRDLVDPRRRVVLE